MGFLSKSSGNKESQNSSLTPDNLPIQTKLRYGKSNDSYEQEADRVADSVVNNSSKSNSSAAPAATAPSISNYVQKQGAEEDKKDPSEAENEKQEDQDKDGEKKDENKDEDKSVQKKEEEKKDEEKPVQKKSTDNKDEEKKVQKKEEGKKEEEKPVQKKEEGKKEEEKPVQKKEEGKKEEEKPVQKKEEGKKEEEKPVQKKEEGKKEEEKPVQKKEEGKKEEEKPVQKKEEGKKDEEKSVQKKESNKAKAEEPAIEKEIMASKSGGKPMEEGIMKEMEKQFSKDFKNVKIHNDPMSYELCRKISALAFTHGNHIYFSEGKYTPNTVEGKRLLAHELTHVVQQGHDVKRKMIQRAGNDAPAPEGSEKKDEFEESGVGKLKKGSDGKLTEVSLDHIKVPSLKTDFGPKAGEKVPIREGERPSDQASVWESKITMTDTAGAKLDGALNKAAATYPKDLKEQLKGKSIYFMKKKGTGDKGGIVKGLIIGNKQEVLQKMKRPQWNKDGKAMPFDVDHKKEIQLGGEHGIENMWLLFSSQNQDSGRNIKDKMVADLNNLVGKAKPTMGDLPSGSKIKKENEIIAINGVKADAGMKPTKEAIKYTKQEVEEGAQIDGLEYLDADSIRKNNLLGDKNNLAIYTSPGGGAKIDVPYDEKQKGKAIAVGKTFGNLKINNVTYNGEGATSSLNITFGEKFKKNLKQPVTFDADLAASDAVAYGGVLSKASVLAQMKAKFPEMKAMSPINLDMIELGENGVEGKGKLKTSIALIDKLDIDISVDGEGIWLSKTFSAGEVKVPKPFKIDECSFTVMVGTAGIGASGDLEFSLEKIGKGSLHAEARQNGFSLEGGFKLDEKIFDGEVKAKYENIEGAEKWKIDGTVKFKKGAITGVKSGTITVGYDGKTLTAKGDAQLDAKWIEKGSLEAEITETTFKITGKFTLAKMPGLESGDGEVTVEKTEGGEYQLKAKGKAKSSIKAVNAELSIEYDKNILTINGSAAYSKGVFSGKIFITVTNGPAPAEAPNAGGADGDFRVYGGGELTAQLTPWLKGTIGVKFDESNQIIFSGKLALASSIEVFGKKEMPEKDLFSMGFDIPIFAIPVGPKSIGLKARIEGALVAYAFIGPGTLEGVELGITYNPDRPDDTVVTGKGSFVIPAEAGIKLAVRASIGLSALVGGVEGGIELAGGLKLQAKASAAIDVNWTPSAGLELNAELSADVTPKFTFEINGFIKAWVAWYEKIWKWNLAAYEYGSNLTLGVTLPIKYKQGQDFNVSYEDMTFRKPDIDPKAVLGGIISDIKNQRA